ncbi:MAG: SEC-C metal-binding domain-containing protein [Kofleriaceae bacterium]
MPSPVVVSSEEVERTIAAFTRLDQRGDKKAMNKLAGRLQREQPNLLQYAAAIRTEHGDKAGEAAVFYATLVWAMFDREREGTLPRITDANLAAAEAAVDAAHGAEAGLGERPVHERFAAVQADGQPHLFAKLRELLEEDVREEAMTAEVAATIFRPTQVAIEAFDAALAGRRPGERQGTIVHDAPKVGRNDVCPCGSGKKYKKCHA